MKELKDTIMEMPLDTVQDAREFVRFLHREKMRFFVDEELKEKERLAYRLVTKGCKTKLNQITYIKNDEMPMGTVGNCYKVQYQGEMIGYVSEFEKGWGFIENLHNFLEQDIDFHKQRKYAVDRYIQSRSR